MLDVVRDGHTVQSGRARHHLANAVVTTTDATTAEERAYLVQTRNTGESIQTISTGVHTFGLRRSEGGWRITELTLTGLFGKGSRESRGPVSATLPVARP